MNRTKILLVNAKPQFVDALAALPNLEVLSLWPRKHDFKEQLDSRPQNCQWYDGGPKLDPRAAWQVRRLVTRLRPDLVHAFYGRSLAHVNLATIGLRRRPAIVSFRGITSRLTLTNAGDWVSYKHPHVDAHACESNAVREALVASGVSPARCRTTYNTMFTPPRHTLGRVALDEFDIPRNAFVIGTIATMRRVKGIDLLLRAAARCEALRDIYWLLIGEVVDPEIRALAATSPLYDRLRLVGARPDASELISAADLFVMPSRAEALCQALLEAMHQGVCPIVSDAGGMKEVVRHERDGLVVPAENVESLAEAICRLYTDRALAARCARSARRRIADEFTPQRMAERSLELYQQVLARRSPRADVPLRMTEDAPVRSATANVVA